MSRDLLPALAPEKEYQPEKWSSLHRYIVLLEVAGKRPGEIAEITGLSNSRVSVILNDKRAELDRISLGSSLADRLVDLNAKLSLYAHEALEVIVDEMRDLTNRAELRVKAGFGILDRAGYTPSSKDESQPPPQIPEEIATRMEVVSRELQEHEFRYRFVDPKMKEIEGDGGETQL